MNRSVTAGVYPVGLYIQGLNHLMPQRFLDEKVFAEAIQSLVFVGADAVFVDRTKRAIYLSKRRIKPMPGWWVIGGRCFAGELPLDAVWRVVKRETSLELACGRFAFLRMNRYLWSERQQEPQDAGLDQLCYTFSVEITPEELAVAERNLDSAEYDQAVGFKEFNLERLRMEKAHPMLCDLWLQLFSTASP